MIKLPHRYLGHQLIIIFALFLCLFSAVLLFSPQKASAAPAGYFSGRGACYYVTWAGRCSTQVSPFLNIPFCGVNDVLFGRSNFNCSGSAINPPDYAVGATLSKSTFANWVVRQLSSGIPQQRTGAAFIINLAVQAGTPGNLPKSQNPSAAMIADFVSRMNNPNLVLSTASGVPGTFSPNNTTSFYDSAINDDFFDVWSGGPARSMLVFTVVGSARPALVIEIPCANPLGGLSGLPRIGWSLTDSSSVNRPTAFPGQTVFYFHAVNNSGPLTASFTWLVQEITYNSAGAQLTAPTVTASVGTITQGVGSANYPSPAGIPRTITAPLGGRQCERIYVEPSNSAGGGRLWSAMACVTVVAPPVTCAPAGVASVTGGNTYIQPGDTTSLVFHVPLGANGTVNYTIKDSSGNIVTSGLATIPPGGVSSNVIPLAPFSAADSYTVIWSLSGTLCPNGGFNVYDTPYFSVYGASVSSGGEFKTVAPNTCAGDGELASWYNNIGSNYGSSTQLAALALVKITGFASAQVVNAPTSLTFANTTLADRTPPASFSPPLGGNLSPGGQNCLSDVAQPTAGASNTTSIQDISSLSTGTHYYSGALVTANGLTINGSPACTTTPATPCSVSRGARITLYVDGDVFIQNDIIYAGSQTWASLSDIPSLTIVANGGNIYIDDGATTLDGVYIAKDVAGGGGTKGKIYTCTKGNAPTFLEPALRLYNKCNQPLLVHGSFVADQINLMRSYGTLNEAPKPYANINSCVDHASVTINGLTNILTVYPSCAAEVFDFSPETYLTNTPSQTTVTSTPQYDSITGLPPVL